MISIVIPTYNENTNIIKIIKEIELAMKNESYEIFFVDDSEDDTPSILENIALQNSHIRFEHRENQRGLASAVLLGFQLAKGDTIFVMDADLQHPPSLIPEMIKKMKEGADIVIPSRFIPGGHDGGLSFSRKIVSWGARFLGKIALPHSLRNIHDSTSGFFAFKKSVIENSELKPLGWKILIEILVRGNYHSVIEIPYSFQPRNDGNSKMSFQEQVNYVHHLIRLLKNSPDDRRFYLFCTVGIFGVVVNFLVYIFAIRILHIPIYLAGIFAPFFAMCFNFILNNRWTWGEKKELKLWIRFLRYIGTSIGGIFINYFILLFLFYRIHINYNFSNLVGILIATFWNYFVNNKWTWRK